ncbi:hypothetical protein EDB80DRAFT_685149 [Ilyonectria destructans]|nr:hypothetical protein EDB80DRAFT_685149 [Ilyonectria destructans]
MRPIDSWSGGPAVQWPSDVAQRRPVLGHPAPARPAWAKQVLRLHRRWAAYALIARTDRFTSRGRKNRARASRLQVGHRQHRDCVANAVFFQAKSNRAAASEHLKARTGRHINAVSQPRGSESLCTAYYKAGYAASIQNRQTPNYAPRLRAIRLSTGLRSVVIPRRAEASTDDQVLQTVSVDDVHINRFPQQVLGDSPKPVDWIPLHPGPGRCIRRRSPSWGQRLSVVVISRRRRPGAGGGQR